jgi:hypothetical protein
MRAEWMNWIAENKALGVPDAEIVDILLANGFDPGWARSHVAGPALQPKKLEALMNIYAELLTIRGVTGVDRVSGLSGSDFFRWYYATNTPVVLLDWIAGWPALASWSPDYLRAHAGDSLVEVMAGRTGDPDYELNCEQHRTEMRLAEFVDRIQAVEAGNDLYMVANNRSFGNGCLTFLFDDIRNIDGVLDRRADPTKIFFWCGPAGTVTPLHHDTMNILLAQVVGRKLVTLIPSCETHLVYNDVGVYSRVDCEAPDYDRFPLFRRASRAQVMLEPGQVLFIPVGWWHHVRSLDISMSVSFTNFVVPNAYVWNAV